MGVNNKFNAENEAVLTLSNNLWYFGEINRYRKSLCVTHLLFI